MPEHTTDGLTIRPATMDDYDEICRLMAQIDRFHRDAHPQYFQEAIPARDRDFLQSYVVDDERDLFVAAQDGRLNGAVTVEVRAAPDFPIFRPRSYVVIDTLVVDEDARSRGIGQVLMQTAHEWGKARGISEFELSVFAFNEGAIRFYRKLGYEISRHKMVWHGPED